MLARYQHHDLQFYDRGDSRQRGQGLFARRYPPLVVALFTRLRNQLLHLVMLVNTLELILHGVWASRLKRDVRAREEGERQEG